MGVNLFRLEERLHHYHGVSIHWCRLKQPLSPHHLQSLKRNFFLNFFIILILISFKIYQ